MGAEGTRDAFSRGIRALFAEMHPAEIALVLESLPPAERDVVWLAIDPGTHADFPSRGVRVRVRAGRIGEDSRGRVRSPANHCGGDLGAVP